MTEQQENIERVKINIAPHVLAFVNARIGKEFRIVDLYQYVASQTKGYTAPASADRILRALKKKGELDYEVISRSQSLYRAVEVNQQRELFR